MKHLSELWLDETRIKELPISVIKNSPGLALLDLSRCQYRRCLPSNICGMASLKKLKLSGCSRLQELPENLGDVKCLEELIVSRTAVLFDKLASRVLQRLGDIWLSKLKCAVCGAQSLLDKKCSRDKLLDTQYANRVKNMLVKLQKIKEEGYKYNLREPRMILDHSRRESSSFVMNSEVHGREEDKENIVKLLLSTTTEEGRFDAKNILMVVIETVRGKISHQSTVEGLHSEVKHCDNDCGVIEYKMHDLIYDFAQSVSGTESIMLNHEVPHEEFSSSECLRKLDLRGCGLEVLDDSIGEHRLFLRIALANISSLKHLHTTGCESLTTILLTIEPFKSIYQKKVSHPNTWELRDLIKKALPKSRNELQTLPLCAFGVILNLLLLGWLHLHGSLNITHLKNVCQDPEHFYEGLERMCKYLPALANLRLLNSLILKGMLGVRTIGKEFYEDRFESNWRPPFPALRELALIDFPNLEEWSSLEEEFPANNTLLTSVEIKSCFKLRSLPAFGGLNVLKPPFGGAEDYPIFQNGSSLLQRSYRTSLRLHSLEIRSCPGLEALPEWIKKLISLRSPAISDCQSITFLPECIKLPTGLHHLSIQDCPTLQNRISRLWMRRIWRNMVLFDKMASPVLDNLDDILNSTNNLEELKENLEEVRAILESAEEKQVADIHARIWASSMIPEASYKAKHLPTLLLFSNGDFAEVPSKVFSSFECLRELGLSRCGLVVLDGSIALPNIANMPSLRHLNTSGCDSLTTMLPLVEPFASLQQNLSPMINAALPKRGNQLRTLPLFVIGSIIDLLLLGQLHLHGNLKITHLNKVHSKMELHILEGFNFNHIESLKLYWGDDKETAVTRFQERKDNYSYGRPQLFQHNDHDHDVANRILSFLQPRQNLKDWRNCKNLPALGNLMLLNNLFLQGIHAVNCIGKDFYGKRRPFEELRELAIIDFPNLEEWLSPDGEESLFPSLEKLSVSKCPKLKLMPQIMSDIQQLELQDCTATFIHSFQNLTSLKVPEIEKVQDLSSFTGEFPANNTLLTSLEIRSCCELHSLPTFGGLTSLESLTIRWCRKLFYLPEGLENLNAMHSFEIDHFEHLVALQSLTILGRFPEFKSFPKELQSLQGLLSLEIRSCPGLEA
ncbi:hypothetical protein FEM48_Zijuj10G0161300 [Ziziphus jujuba var. spinosa]|uniref:Disease resistance protein At3g14460 n=1 Tax=Ziziphus jujuba var. spinosa TaxID=714518 RepID=A0A978UPD3_ZIZJJ|nr:hypothetical protein FEM48_Zijuj10G0161300 [Ziziphus jujuba var. spinosa]